jgi:excinuclease ABC subunit C
MTINAKIIESMKQFAENYAKSTDTFFCHDLEVTESVILGLAKNKEELFFANDQQSILLDWNSDCLKLIRRIRDEVHRFGITYHRNLRSKNALENELETIYGIGETTANELLKNYKSIKKVSSAPFNELVNLIGKTKAEIIASYFKKKSLNM